MPSVTYPFSQNVTITRYDSAKDVLRDVDFSERELDANCILPLLQKVASSKPYPPTTLSSKWTADFWLVLSSSSASRPLQTEFVLSCTNSAIGAYPIFIWSSKPVYSMSPEFIQSRMATLAQSLMSNIKSVRRAYSVFAPLALSQAFAASWSRISRCGIVDEPYYAATFASVNLSTLVNEDRLSKPATPNYSIRRAKASDAAGVANLCYEFALTCDPFILDEETSMKEAVHLIESGIVYVCEVKGQIASIAAVTRKSSNVAAITKVTTHPAFLQQGWAKRLVREVSMRLLTEEKKSDVVLYAGIGNKAAEKTYYGLGFSALYGRQATPGTDPHWIEIGFQNTDLGHW